MASPAQIPAKKTTTVKFARKTSSGRYVSLSREDLDSMNYTVQMPTTPDNQPMDEEAEAAHLTPHEPLHGGIPRPRPINRTAACAMPECNQLVMQDEHGCNIHPCECRYVCLPLVPFLILQLGICPKSLFIACIACSCIKSPEF